MTALYHLSNDLISIQNKLESGELSQEDIADTLEGLEGQFSDKFEDVVKFIKSQKSYSEQLKAESDSFKKRADNAKKTAENVQTYLISELQRLGKSEFKSGLQEVKLRKPSKVLKITGEVPVDYQLPAKLIIDPDKNLIKQAMKNGEKLDFAELEDGKQTLIIK